MISAHYMVSAYKHYKYETEQHDTAIKTKAFSQQVSYITLEQHSTISAEEDLNVTQKKEVQRQSPYGEMRRRPVPLMSKGEEEKTTGGRAGKQKEQATRERESKQRKGIAINAKGGDCWKYCH